MAYISKIKNLIMKIYTKYLIKVKFKRRFKRFFVECKMGDQTFFAHCPNTGSLLTCLRENAPVLVSYSNHKNRKLYFTLEMIKPQNSWIYVHTIEVNRIIEYYLINKHHLLSFVNNYQYLKREPKIDEHRFDFILYNKEHRDFLQRDNISLSNSIELDFSINKDVSKDIMPAIVEIKNVTYYNKEINALQFPDAITKRGTQHLKILMKLNKINYKTILIFVLSRNEGNYFIPAYHIDPEFGNILQEFYHNKGSIIPIRLKFNLQKLKKNIIDLKELLNFPYDIYKLSIDLKELIPFRFY